MGLEGYKRSFRQLFTCFWILVPGSLAVGPAEDRPDAATGPGADWHYITGRLKSSLGQMRAPIDSFRYLMQVAGVPHESFTTYSFMFRYAPWKKLIGLR